MNKWVILALVLLLVLISGVVIVRKKDDGPAKYPNGDEVTDDYKKVEEFNYIEPNEPGCAALLPECGFCPGVIIEKECFMPVSQGSPELLQP